MTGLAVLVLVCAAFISSGAASVCDHQFGKTCYEFSKEEVTNRYARKACGTGKLADATNSRVVNFLSNMLKERNENVAWVEGSPTISVDGACPFRLTKNGESEYDLLFESEDCKNDKKLFAICEFDVKAAPKKKCKVHDSIIKNGFLIPCTKQKGVDPGTKLKVECWSGYSLKGPEEITCKETGKWSEKPLCEPVCAASLLEVDGITVYPLSKMAGLGEQVTYYKVNETALIVCENGIFGNSTFPVTHKVVMCLGSNRWSEILPHCVPYDKITSSNLMRAENVILVGDHTDETIKCPSDVDSSRKVWTKDQQQLSPDKKHSISEDGTLTIRNFTIGDEGRYKCTIETPSSGFHFVSYDLRVASPDAYFTAENLEVIKMKEGESKVLYCKDTNYSCRQKWYKDGIGFYGTSLGSIITDDGALYLNNVSPLDNGLYFCVVECQVQGGDTSLIVSPYEIRVTPTAKAVCGKLFYELNPTKRFMDDDEREEAGYSDEHVPWFVSLFRRGDKMPFCYGNLVDVRWVLTSAQCFKNIDRKNDDLIVSVGLQPIDKRNDIYETIRNNEKITIHFIHPRNFTVPVQFIDNHRHFYLPYEINEKDLEMILLVKAEPQETEHVDVEEVIIHPDYDGLHVNDLALVHLIDEVHITDIVRTICLPHLLKFADDVKCEEARIRDGVVTTRGQLHLQDRDMMTRGKVVEIHRRQKCNKIFEINYPPNMFCVEDPMYFENETKLYKGDLGSPLEVMWLGQATLWGIHVGSKWKYFEFYNEVLPYLDWIKETMGEK